MKPRTYNDEPVKLPEPDRELKPRLAPPGDEEVNPVRQERMRRPDPTPPQKAEKTKMSNTGQMTSAYAQTLRGLQKPIVLPPRVLFSQAAQVTNPPPISQLAPPSPIRTPLAQNPFFRNARGEIVNQTGELVTGRELVNLLGAVPGDTLESIRQKREGLPLLG